MNGWMPSDKMLDRAIVTLSVLAVFGLLVVLLARIAAL